MPNPTDTGVDPFDTKTIVTDDDIDFCEWPKCDHIIHETHTDALDTCPNCTLKTSWELPDRIHECDRCGIQYDSEMKATFCCVDRDELDDRFHD